MTTQDLDLTADVIDVRDIIARVEELEELTAAANESGESSAETVDDKEELDALLEILNDLKGYGGDEKWRGNWYPVTLIRDSYFEEAMDELVHDCYEVPKNLPSFMTITLDYVALQMDYTSTDIDGVTYWYR